jgi:hypothetical protein
LVLENKDVRLCSGGSNPAAKAAMRFAAEEIRKITCRDSELSSVARYCVLFRNDPLLVGLVS